MKEYMQPKWWLIGVGTIFTIYTLLIYTETMDAAESGWGKGNVLAHDAFYEKAWAATYLLVAIICVVSGLFVEGRSQAIIAMTIGGGNIFNFILVYLAAGDLDYGYTNDIGQWAPPMVMATCLLVSGFLHLEEDE